MDWLFHRNYFGPDRRGGRFQVRFFERRNRKEAPSGTRASLREALREMFERGMRWVDTAVYFGPDRRTGEFSHFILERRRHDEATFPPPLHAALRQLRVRVLQAGNAAGRGVLQDRLTATAILADAQGRSAIGDLLMRLVDMLEKPDANVDLSTVLHAKLLDAEALLGDPPETVARSA